MQPRAGDDEMFLEGFMPASTDIGKTLGNTSLMGQRLTDGFPYF